MHITKKAIRLVAGAKFRAHMDPLFQSLKILKLRDLIFLERAVFVHKFRHRKLPDAFSRNFLELVDAENLTRRQDPGHYVVPENNHKLTPRSPLMQMITDWNSLPFPTKSIACHRAFKSEVINTTLASYSFYCTLPSCMACSQTPLLDNWPLLVGLSLVTGYTNISGFEILKNSSTKWSES